MKRKLDMKKKEYEKERTYIENGWNRKKNGSQIFGMPVTGFTYSY